MIRTLARRAALAAVVPLMTMLAVAPGTALASTPSAMIQFQNQAQLISGGVLVTVDYSCMPGIGGTDGTLDVNVTQPGAASLMGAVATCDDQKHQLTMLVMGGFSPGSATANGLVFNDNFSSTASTQAELKVS